MLDRITPVLLTYNEAENIGRTLSRLTWARDVVVVDGGSTDATLAILATFAQVRVFKRSFDTHANQWRYAVQETCIGAPWILRLDADYQVSDKLVRELATLDPDAPVDAYRVVFDYAIFSHPLRSSLYPPNTVLLRKDRFIVWDRGHTEAWAVQGPVGLLGSRIVHDDWKSTDRWVVAQGRYMRREWARLKAGHGRLRDRLRLWPPLMPMVVFFYCLFGKGLILNGRAGLFYALQRMVAEAILSLMVLEDMLRTSEHAMDRREADRAETHPAMKTEGDS